MSRSIERPGVRLPLEVKPAGKLSEEEVDAVTELIVVAFGGVPFSPIIPVYKLAKDTNYGLLVDDPFFRHLVGDDPTLTPHQFRSEVAAANVGGTILLGTTKNEAGEDELVGCLIAFAPGQSLDSTKEQVTVGRDSFIAKVDAYTRNWWLNYWIPLLDRTYDSAFGEGEALRSWDLQLLGVRPEHHGKGVASTLMRYAKALADAQNAPMILDTQNERNVAMYNRMGFEVKDVINVESKAGTSRFWFMGRGL